MTRDDPHTRIPRALLEHVRAHAKATDKTLQFVWNDIYNEYFLNMDRIYNTPAAGDAQIKESDDK